MSILLGGKRSAPEEAPPSPFGASAADPALPEAPAEEMGEASGLTPDMLSYHSGDENCGACLHFTEPSTCDRWPDPVDAAGHCEGFQSGDTGDQEQAADMEPMEQLA